MSGNAKHGKVSIKQMDVNKLELELGKLQIEITQLELADNIPQLVIKLKAYYLLDISYMNLTGRPYLIGGEHNVKIEHSINGWKNYKHK